MSYLYTLFLTGLAVYVVSTFANSVITRYRLKGIPDTRLLGSSWPGAYYYEVVKFLWNGRTILRDAYTMQHGTSARSAFKIPEMRGWHIIVSGKEMIRDMTKASDKVLNIEQGFDESLSIKYTMGESLLGNPYLNDVVRGPLTRSISTKFWDICDEIREALQDEIPTSSKWRSIKVTPMTRRVVSRTSNRLFVGLPLCRDTTFVNLNIEFTTDLVRAGIILGLFPPFLRPWIAPLLRDCPQKIKIAQEILEPIIRERLENEKEWDGRPNDLLSWILDYAPEEYKTAQDITLRVLFLNFGAIHMTSMTFATALLNLAAYTEYIQPLREEIEATVKGFGWTKAAMGKMTKLDSFMKETMRMNSLSCLSVTRKVVEDFTFSNGTRVPSGTFLSVAADAIHHDETIYSDHTIFNGFRFAELKQSSEGDSFKHHMVTPSSDYLLFGHGKHACPGRFFAVNQLKAAVAHVLVTYDIKLEDDRKVPPEPKWFGSTHLADEMSKVMFRKRVK